MHLQDVIAYEKDRFRNPWVRVPVLALGGSLLLAWSPALMNSSAGRHPTVWLVLGLSAFALPALFLWTSPAPWLWTGGRATHAPLWRGIVQSALFNAFVLLLLSSLQVGIFFLTGVDWGWIEAAGGVYLLMFTWCPATMLAGYSITIWERTSFARKEAEKRLREAQWVLLRGQLSPHVLFNALNGLAELVHIDPHAAEKGILNLSELYRALLVHGSKPMATLSEERRLVSRYLEMESLRLGDRLKVRWNWDEELGSIETPPFLIQPLVENALKHGINPSVTGGELFIELISESSGLVIRVSNQGKALPMVLGDGVGVANLEARLGLAFGKAAKLRLFGDGGWTVAEIRIDLETARRKA